MASALLETAYCRTSTLEVRALLSCSMKKGSSMQNLPSKLLTSGAQQSSECQYIGFVSGIRVARWRPSEKCFGVEASQHVCTVWSLRGPLGRDGQYSIVEAYHREGDRHHSQLSRRRCLFQQPKCREQTHRSTWEVSEMSASLGSKSQRTRSHASFVRVSRNPESPLQGFARTNGRGWRCVLGFQTP